MTVIGAALLSLTPPNKYALEIHGFVSSYAMQPPKCLLSAPLNLFTTVVSIISIGSYSKSKTQQWFWDSSCVYLDFLGQVIFLSTF